MCSRTGSPLLRAVRPPSQPAAPRLRNLHCCRGRLTDSPSSPVATQLWMQGYMLISIHYRWKQTGKSLLFRKLLTVYIILAIRVQIAYFALAMTNICVTLWSDPLCVRTAISWMIVWILNELPRQIAEGTNPRKSKATYYGIYKRPDWINYFIHQ